MSLIKNADNQRRLCPQKLEAKHNKTLPEVLSQRPFCLTPDNDGCERNLGR